METTPETTETTTTTYHTFEVDPQWIYSLRLDSLAREIGSRLEKKGLVAKSWKARGKAEQVIYQSMVSLIEMGLTDLGGYCWDSETKELIHPGMLTRKVAEEVKE